MNRQQRRAAQRDRARLHRLAERSGSNEGLVELAARSLDEGDHEAAELAARDALAADPTSVPARLLLSRSLRHQHRIDEAMLEARRLVRQAASDADVHLELAKVLLACHRDVEAIGRLERAADLAPDRADVLTALGVALVTTGVLDLSLEHLERAAVLAPDHPNVYLNLGVVHERRGDYAAASRAYDRATALGTASDDLRWNRSLARLGVGDPEGAWMDYDAGFSIAARRPDRTGVAAPWDGTPCPGARVLFWREQGIGDEIRFASCLREVLPRVGTAVLEVTDRLVPLFARSFPEAEVRPAPQDDARSVEARVTDVDLQMPFGGLPRLVRRTLADFDRAAPYLVADAARRRDLRQKLDEAGVGPLVGINWRSLYLATSRLAAYTTLDEWDAVLRIPGVRFVNLQYGDEGLLEAELTAAERRLGVQVLRFPWLDYTNDLDTIAALTAELDAVIGTSSTPTVMSAALGRETHVLAPCSPYYVGTTRDPWFPTVTLHERSWDQTWDEPMMQVARAVERLRDRTGVKP